MQKPPPATKNPADGKEAITGWQGTIVMAGVAMVACTLLGILSLRQPKLRRKPIAHHGAPKEDEEEEMESGHAPSL